MPAPEEANRANRARNPGEMDDEIPPGLRGFLPADPVERRRMILGQALIEQRLVRNNRPNEPINLHGDPLIPGNMPDMRPGHPFGRSQFPCWVCLFGFVNESLNLHARLLFCKVFSSGLD